MNETELYFKFHSSCLDTYDGESQVIGFAVWWYQLSNESQHT